MHFTPLLQNLSPYEYLFGQLPNYLKLRKFGCLCYPLTRSYNTNKLQPKSRPCVFLGYSQTQNAYKCMDTTTKRLFLSRHVLFDENRHVPPIPPDVSSHSLPTSVSSPFVLVPCSPSVSMPSHQSSSSTQEGDTTIAASSSGNISVPQSSLPQLPSTCNPSPSDLLSSSPINPTPPNPSAPVTSSSRVHPMITRSMHNIFKPKQLNLVTKHPLPETVEPSNVTQALSNP